MKIIHCICLGLIILGALIFFDKNPESIDSFSRILEILISGYLGFIVNEVKHYINDINTENNDNTISN